MADEKALYVEVMPNGSKYFRMKYRFDGKEKRMALGVYPEVSLKEAREKRDEARKLLAQGIDPAANRKALKVAQVAEGETFEVVAREWLDKYKPTWTPGHGDKIMARMEKDVFPWLGAKRAQDITAPLLLECLRRIEARGALDTAHRTLQNCSQVFRYAIATGRAARDPSPDLRGALPPVRQKHFAARQISPAGGTRLDGFDSR